MDTGYLTTQVATIIGQLHGLFDEIGVPDHERESRESEVYSQRAYGNVQKLIRDSSLLLYQKHYTTNCAWSLRMPPRLFIGIT